MQFNGSSSEPFEIRSGVKQGCVLAPTLFGIFFGMLLKHAFDTTTEGIYLRTRSDGRLFNLARLRARTKVCKVLIRNILFADDAAVATHTQEELQSLMDCFSQACKDFGLTISLKKTNVLEQDTEALLVITIDDYELDAVSQFIYLGSTITDNLSLDAEIDKRIGKAASTLARLTARVWTSPKLSVKTKMAVYNACVISTLLYGSETWTTYAGQERRLNTFHLRSIRRILVISWQDKVPTLMSCLVLVFPLCTPCSDNADCVGWVMSAVWRMVAFQKTSSTVSWHWGGEPPAALTCDIKMSVQEI